MARTRVCETATRRGRRTPNATGHSSNGAGALTESVQYERHQGVYDLRALKLDHFQPVKQILFQKMYTFLSFYPASHNKPFLITRRERKERKEGWKWEKGNSWDPGFSDPWAFKVDHLRSVKLTVFQNIYHLFIQPPIINHFLLVITPERKEGRSRGWKWEKETLETQGFPTLGHLNWTICSPLNWFSS